MSYFAAFERTIRPTLDAIDKVREILKNEDQVKLPSIVVIGDQSAGKSSVLESIAGVDLPRGDGIVTRCPLILALKNSEEEKAMIGDSSQGSMETIQLEQIETKIRDLTKTITGGNPNTISTNPIHLNVFKSGVPDLTLIDLPGIVHTVMQGQDESMIKEIEQMIIKHIEPKESIILVVIQSNNDLATCKALGMAKKVDPELKRTIGVLSKIDKHEKGVSKVLLGQSSNMLLFVTEPMQSCNKELPFPNVSDTYKGTESLCNKLVTIQHARIEQILPDVKAKVDDLLMERRNQLEEMPSACSNSIESNTQFQRCVNRFERAMHDQLLGSHVEDTAAENIHTFIKQCVDCIGEEFGAAKLTAEDVYKECVKLVNKSSCTTPLPNFLNMSAFRMLCSKVIATVTMPVETLISKVEVELVNVVTKAAEIAFEGFPALENQAKRLSIEFVKKMVEKAIRKPLREQVKMEKQIIYTTSVSYNDMMSRMKEHINARKQSSPQKEFIPVPGTDITKTQIDMFCARNNLHALEMQLSLYCYLQIARCRFDAVGMYVKNYTQVELFSHEKHAKWAYPTI